VAEVDVLELGGVRGILVGEDVGQGAADPRQDLRADDLASGDRLPGVDVAGHDSVDRIEQGAIKIEEDDGPSRCGTHGGQLIVRPVSPILVLALTPSSPADLAAPNRLPAGRAPAAAESTPCECG